MWINKDEPKAMTSHRTHTLTSVRIKHYATLNLRLVRIPVCGTGSWHFIRFQFNMVKDAIFRAHLENTKFKFFSLWNALLMSNLTILGLHLIRKRLQQVKFNFILIIKCLCGQIRIQFISIETDWSLHFWSPTHSSTCNDGVRMETSEWKSVLS